MADNVMLIGESFTGASADAAHVNTVPRSRPAAR
jgi:hypothetical protein